MIALKMARAEHLVAARERNEAYDRSTPVHEPVNVTELDVAYVRFLYHETTQREAVAAMVELGLDEAHATTLLLGSTLPSKLYPLPRRSS